MPLFSRIHPISVKPITILRSKWLQSIPYFHQNGSKTTHTYKAQIGEYLQSPLIKCPPPPSNKHSLGCGIIQTETIILSNEYEKNGQNTMHEVRKG